MRYAKHFDKDLYSKWHRKYEGIAMCDIDSVEICRNKGCWQPLALIEHVYDTGNYKKYTNVIKSLGKAANMPVFLVFYKKTTQDSLTFRIKRITSCETEFGVMNESQWVSILLDLQANHKKVCKYDKN